MLRYRLTCIFFYAAACVATFALFDLTTSDASSTMTTVLTSIGGLVIFILTAAVLHILKEHVQKQTR